MNKLANEELMLSIEKHMKETGSSAQQASRVGKTFAQLGNLS